MSRRYYWLFMAMTLFGIQAGGQTAEELKLKYPSADMVLIQPRVLMSTFFNGGSLCGAYFQANHIPTHSEFYIGNGIPPDDLSGAIESLASDLTSNTLGYTNGFRAAGEGMEAGFNVNDVGIEVWAAERKSPAEPLIIPEVADNTPVKRQLTIKDFMRAFGKVDVAKLWWSRRNGCHEK